MSSLCTSYSRPRFVCNDYLHSFPPHSCPRGPTCRFIHPTTPSALLEKQAAQAVPYAQSQLCNRFLKGICEDGDECTFAHDRDVREGQQRGGMRLRDARLEEEDTFLSSASSTSTPTTPTSPTSTEASSSPPSTFSVLLSQVHTPENAHIAHQLKRRKPREFVCRYYLISPSKCRWGDDCHDLHPVDPAALQRTAALQQQVHRGSCYVQNRNCTFFQRGSCDKPDCLFIHQRDVRDPRSAPPPAEEGQGGPGWVRRRPRVDVGQLSKLLSETRV